MNKEKKENLILILVILEFILGCVFFVVNAILVQKNHVRTIWFYLSALMFFIALVTIVKFDLSEKVVNVAKKVGGFVFAITIGLVFRAFDALFDMATGSRDSRINIIRGYVDNETSVRKEKKRKRANYKRYKLMDNREKIQFLYYKTVTKAIRKGFFFKESDTALEVNEKLVNKKYLKGSKYTMGEIYSVSKYNCDGNITDEMVDAMKESC